MPHFVGVDGVRGRDEQPWLLADAVHCQWRVNIKLHAGRFGAGRLSIPASWKVLDSDNPQ
jgi:hypothetical protein